MKTEDMEEAIMKSRGEAMVSLFAVLGRCFGKVQMRSLDTEDFEDIEDVLGRHEKSVRRLVERKALDESIEEGKFRSVAVLTSVLVGQAVERRRLTGEEPDALTTSMVDSLTSSTPKES